MHPILCQIGPVTVYSYGVALALAVLVCSFLLSREAKRRGFSAETIMDLVFWVVLSGIVGARLFFIALNFSQFAQEPLEIFKLQHGGLAFQGSLVGGLLAGVIFVKVKALPFWKLADLAAPYIALGHAIGRLGCFFNGCCYGLPVSWGIYFPVHHDRLHPTQLYESLGLLLIFFILKQYDRTKHSVGQVFILYLMLASILRFTNEFFRADHEPFLGSLSVFQVVSLAILVIALYANTLLKSRSRK